VQKEKVVGRMLVAEMAAQVNCLFIRWKALKNSKISCCA
jgi:hypothetical protein